MKKLLMTLLIILIMGCAGNGPAVIPPIVKYCSRPVRPTLIVPDKLEGENLVKTLTKFNLTLSDYSFKLEETLTCWESK